MTEKTVILDPTGLQIIPPDCIAITTEVEWLQHFYQENKTYWIKGKKLCEWTREYLQTWNQTQAIIDEKQPSNLELEITPENHTNPAPETTNPSPQNQQNTPGFNIDEFL